MIIRNIAFSLLIISSGCSLEEMEVPYSLNKEAWNNGAFDNHDENPHSNVYYNINEQKYYEYWLGKWGSNQNCPLEISGGSSSLTFNSRNCDGPYLLTPHKMNTSDKLSRFRMEINVRLINKGSNYDHFGEVLLSNSNTSAGSGIVFIEPNIIYIYSTEQKENYVFQLADGNFSSNKDILLEYNGNRLYVYQLNTFGEEKFPLEDLPIDIPLVDHVTFAMPGYASWSLSRLLVTPY